MPRLLPLLIFLSVFSPGCGSDRDAPLEVAFPRVVEIENGSQDRIDLRALSNTPDAKATFLLIGGVMAPGGKRSWRIDRDGYDDILSGRFVLDGACGDIEPWQLPGTALIPHMTRQDDQGKVIIAIPACGG